MLGKMLTFGFGVVTGVYLAPKVQRFRAQFSADLAPEPTVELPEPVILEISEPEDTTKFDAAVEAFLRTSAEMAGELAT